MHDCLNAQWLQYEHEENVGQLPLDAEVIPARLFRSALDDYGSRLVMLKKHRISTLLKRNGDTHIDAIGHLSTFRCGPNLGNNPAMR